MAQIFGNLSKNFNAKIFGNSKFLKSPILQKRQNIFELHKLQKSLIICKNCQKFPNCTNFRKLPKSHLLLAVTDLKGISVLFLKEAAVSLPECVCLVFLLNTKTHMDPYSKEGRKIV